MQQYFIYRMTWCFGGAPHQETKLLEDEWKYLLKKGGLLVRNTFDFDQPLTSHFWYIIKDQFNGFEGVSSKCRNKVRKATKNYSYRIIENNTLKEKGFSIYKEVMLSYGNNNVTKNDFLAYFDTENTECWGCFLNDKQTMVGFAINCLWEKACGYEFMAFLPEYKHNSTYPYYGLVYAMNEYYLGQKQLKYVSDGSRSITEHSQIQDFLIQNFKFRKAYCQLAVHYKWWVKIAVKMLYPFKKIITFPRVKAILNMEAMQRGEK